jgi:hypothetical protein
VFHANRIRRSIISHKPAGTQMHPRGGRSFEGVVSRDSSRSSALSIRARTGLRCTENSTSFRKILARRSLLAVSARDL